MSAYNELYLDDAMRALGDMVDYAVHDLGYEPDEFWSYFLTSGIARQFECAFPKYVGGMSGYELALRVLTCVGIETEFVQPARREDRSAEYWAGWALAYYQWYSGRRFAEMAENGLTLSTVISMYILHEADLSKFVEAAESVVLRNQKKARTNLYQIRKARGYTQSELSAASGVSLRMIQLYEQRQNDINKAQACVVAELSDALGCEMRDLMESEEKNLSRKSLLKR